MGSMTSVWHTCHTSSSAPPADTHTHPFRPVQGQWAIGIYKGPSPFQLQPLELARPRVDAVSAWPAANPVYTCAHVQGSSFVADPFIWPSSDGKASWLTGTARLAQQGSRVMLWAFTLPASAFCLVRGIGLWAPHRT